jgi:ABC-type lipoprotein release transport system permease subunit
LDIRIFAAATIVLLAAAILATLFPAIKAGDIDPATVIKSG